MLCTPTTFGSRAVWAAHDPSVGSTYRIAWLIIGIGGFSKVRRILRVREPHLGGSGGLADRIIAP